MSKHRVPRLIMSLSCHEIFSLMLEKQWKVRVLVAQLCLTLREPHGLQPARFLSMGFSRQEYWSGLPFPSPGDLPDPGIEPESPALQADSLMSEPLGEAREAMGRETK